MSKYFLFLASRAYNTGPRKRHKIETVPGMSMTCHKTGNTLPCKVNGRQIGWKKILVLYIGYCDKRNNIGWVMHQYHIGDEENEYEGELVVCKVYNQESHT